MQNLTTLNAKASAYVTKKGLEVAEWRDIYGRFGAAPIPRKDDVPLNSSATVQWFRYEHLALATAPIQRGVKPDAVTASRTDITANLTQYGSYVLLDDVSIMTVEDPLLDIEGDRCATQAIRSINVIREGVLMGGTNITYANGAAITDVNTLISRDMISKTVRSISIAMGRRLTKILSATDGFNTTPIPASYVGVAHSYVKWDLRYTVGETNGFIPKEKYARNEEALPNEFGECGDVRFCEHEEMTYTADGGGNTVAGHKSTGSAKDDVFSTLIFSQESYGISQLGGYKGGRKGDGIKMIVKNIGSGGASDDPLDQLASVGWKCMTATQRLNENWMAQVLTAASA